MISTNELSCHPYAPCAAVERLRAFVDWQSGGNLHLRYELAADLSQILIPAGKPPAPADGLWEHTCFEAFVGLEGSPGYREFNFSPSGEWAAYAFGDYRLQNPWQTAREPDIRLNRAERLLQLDAVIAASDMPANAGGKPYRIGLSAVIETADGFRSYWALHHSALRPDFHDRGGFVLSLKAPFPAEALAIVK